MPLWFDQSNNANKLRQSYFKGFIDMSGGDLFIRSDGALNLYTTNDGVTPKFNISAEKTTVYDGSSQYHTFYTSQFIYVKDLSYGTQSQLNTLKEKTQWINSDISNTFVANKLNVSSDTSLNANLYVGGQTTLLQNVGIGKAPSSTFALDVSGIINCTNIAFGSGSGSGLSIPSTITGLEGLVIYMDSSLNSRLFVGGDASFNGNVNIVGNLSLPDQTVTAKTLNVMDINTSGDNNTTGNVSLINGNLTLYGGLFVQF
jgi:hypothetical protein